jgi:hypothetical protein
MDGVTTIAKFVVGIFTKAKILSMGRDIRTATIGYVSNVMTRCSGKVVVHEQYNRSFHLTKPLVTHLAFARSAPTDFAGEANVRFARE